MERAAMTEVVSPRPQKSSTEPTAASTASDPQSDCAPMQHGMTNAAGTIRFRRSAARSEIFEAGPT
jgi:hypothetical protein